MKNKLMIISEKLALKRRNLIECVNDLLMTICDIEGKYNFDVLEYFFYF